MNVWLKQDILDLHTTIHAHFFKIRAEIVLEDLPYLLTHKADGFYDPQILEMPGKEAIKRHVNLSAPHNFPVLR
jgi:hypothetical protein